MARYGKTNKSLKKLIESTCKRNLGQTCIRRNGTAVYELHNDPDRLRLFHYGTLILDYSYVSSAIIYYGGYSASDRDALNTALDCLNHRPGDYFRIEAGELTLVAEVSAHA